VTIVDGYDVNGDANISLINLKTGGMTTLWKGAGTVTIVGWIP
jgi:hypothetical protein